MHRRLDYLLLFALRALMLLLLALLFAEPFFHFVKTAKGLGQKITVVAVDNSAVIRRRRARGKWNQAGRGEVAGAFVRRHDSRGSAGAGDCAEHRRCRR